MLVQLIRDVVRSMIRWASRGTLAGATTTTATVTTEDATEALAAALMQHYGFASRPADGVEAFVVFRAGQTHGATVVATGSDGAPVLASGEVAVYHRSGAKIHFNATGDIIIEPKAGQTIQLHGNTNKVAREHDDVGLLFDVGNNPDWFVWFTAINAVIPGFPVAGMTGTITSGNAEVLSS